MEASNSASSPTMLVTPDVIASVSGNGTPQDVRLFCSAGLNIMSKASIPQSAATLDSDSTEQCSLRSIAESASDEDDRTSGESTFSAKDSASCSGTPISTKKSSTLGSKMLRSSAERASQIACQEGNPCGVVVSGRHVARCTTGFRASRFHTAWPNTATFSSNFSDTASDRPLLRKPLDKIGRSMGSTLTSSAEGADDCAHDESTRMSDKLLPSHARKVFEKGTATSSTARAPVARAELAV
mmetsp:Transcript_11070/g.24010  ORF Transcript_11070/g.24010 Transcript_11070/m.24010 type:complete len:241 (-) Transcript_11070:732-1454(-)